MHLAAHPPVTINEQHPFGLYVSYPRFFEGERQDDRLKWYASTTAKDIVMTAGVSKRHPFALRYCLACGLRGLPSFHG